MSRVILTERVKDKKAEDTLKRAAESLEGRGWENRTEIDGLVCIAHGDWGTRGHDMFTAVLESIREHYADKEELNILYDGDKGVICFDKAGFQMLDARLENGIYEIETFLFKRKSYRDTILRFKIPKR